MVILKRECDYDFDSEKLIASARLSYDFYKKWNENSERTTQCSRICRTDEGLKSLLSQIESELNSVDNFRHYCTVASDEDIEDYWNSYGNKLNLFATTENYNIWIRLVPVETDNNVYIKFYTK